MLALSENIRNLHISFLICTGLSEDVIRVYLKTGNMTNSEEFFAC